MKKIIKKGKKEKQTFECSVCGEIIKTDEYEIEFKGFFEEKRKLEFSFKCSCGYIMKGTVHI